MKTARNHIKDAIKLYRKNDATEFGSYRDVIIDLLHLLRANKTAQKSMPIQSGKPDLFYVLQEGWDVFNEECLHAEIAIIDKAARKNELPLLIGTLESEAAIKLLNERMKELFGTRCQIGFYKSEQSKINRPYVLLYKHSDGYPDHTLPLLVDILGKFEARRDLDDEEYLPAWVSWFLINNSVEACKEDVRKAKERGFSELSYQDGISCLGHGLCFDKKFHGDIEFYYRITPEKLHVYETGYDLPPEQWKEIHTIELKDLEKRLPTLIGICQGLDELIAERIKQ